MLALLPLLLVLDAPCLSFVISGRYPYASPGHLEFYCLFTFLLTVPDCLFLEGKKFLIYFYAIVFEVNILSQVCIQNP